MSNVIQIKHGQSAPGAGVLKSHELGFVDSDDRLIIGADGECKEIRVGYANWATSAERAESAGSAGSAENAMKLGQKNADEYATVENLTKEEEPLVVNEAISALWATSAEIANLAHSAESAESAESAGMASEAEKANTANLLYSPGYCRAKGAIKTNFVLKPNGSYYANISLEGSFIQDDDNKGSTHSGIINKDSNCFRIVTEQIDGQTIKVLKINKTGPAVISGSIYMSGCTSNTARGVYIYRKSAGGSAYNEIHSVQFMGVGSGAICTGPIIEFFNQGDTVYFAGRSEDGQGYCSGDNVATHLDVFFLPAVNTTTNIFCTGISLEQDQILHMGPFKLFVGTQGTISAIVTPENCTEEILWSSSDESVVIVENGTYTVTGNGDCTITATCGSYSATCPVTINGKEPVKCQGISLNPTQCTVTVFDEINIQDKIDLAIVPENCTDLKFWQSSDESIARINKFSGYLEAVKPGNCTITATCGSYSATCALTISHIACTGISLDKTNLVFNKPSTFQIATITAAITPENTTEKINWTSSDPSIATANNNATMANSGTITVPGKGGSCTITATCGSYSATCRVTVIGADEEIPCTGLTLSNTKMDLKTYESATITATVTPEFCTDSIEWSTSDVNIASIKSESAVFPGGSERRCVVTGRSKTLKVATITAVCGNYRAECQVTVSQGGNQTS